MESIHAEELLLKDVDLEVKFKEEEVFNEEYVKVHPQTKAFVTRFGLDLRLFERDLVLGKGRTFSEAFD
jgi:hypothetical protein